jgi:hypothetical protein
LSWSMKYMPENRLPRMAIRNRMMMKRDIHSLVADAKEISTCRYA